MWWEAVKSLIKVKQEQEYANEMKKRKAAPTEKGDAAASKDEDGKKEKTPPPTKQDDAAASKSEDAKKEMQPPPEADMQPMMEPDTQPPDDDGVVIEVPPAKRVRKN